MVTKNDLDLDLNHAEIPLSISVKFAKLVVPVHKHLRNIKKV